MNDRDQLREDRLTRVQTFGTENAASFPAGSKGRMTQILLAAGADVEALNTIIQNKYARVPEKLHVWKTASRIHRAPTKKEPAADGGTNPTPTP